MERETTAEELGLSMGVLDYGMHGKAQLHSRAFER